MRFAYNEYLRSGSSWPGLIGTPVSFRGIFEIGPTDGGVNGQFQDALGTAWNVLLPACDWDVPGLDGTRVFDRMIGQTEPTALPKSFYHVWGTNHNFYNSEWQQPDANLGGGITGCIDHTPIYDATQPGSAAQREIGRFAAVTFFTANVGADRVPSRNALFDPAFRCRSPRECGAGITPAAASRRAACSKTSSERRGRARTTCPTRRAGP